MDEILLQTDPVTRALFVDLYTSLIFMSSSVKYGLENVTKENHF